MPLIFSKTVESHGYCDSEPASHAHSGRHGPVELFVDWCFLRRGPAETETCQIPPVLLTSPANSSIKKLELKDGQINIGSTISQKRSTYDHVSISASDVSLATRFSVVVTAELARRR